LKFFNNKTITKGIKKIRYIAGVKDITRNIKCKEKVKIIEKIITSKFFLSNKIRNKTVVIKNETIIEKIKKRLLKITGCNKYEKNLNIKVIIGSE